MNTLTRLVYWGISLYTLAAIVFTTWFYVLLPVARLVHVGSPFGTSTYTTGRTKIHVEHPAAKALFAEFAASDFDLDSTSFWDDNLPANTWPPGYSSSELVHFGSSQKSPLHAPGFSRTPGYAVHEDTLLSKAFSDAVHPTRIIPFYFKASRPVDPDDVTITTLITSNRFRVFKQLVERYRGPISVTIHLPLPLRIPFSSLAADHPSRLALNNLHTLYASSPLFSEHVDVHLAVSPFTNGYGNAKPSMNGPSHSAPAVEGERQFNLWRNVARLFARSEFVMLLDVDFAVCTDFRGFVRDAVRAAAARPIRHAARTPAAPHRRADAPGARAPPNANANADENANANTTDVIRRLREGTAALVVPAFEYVKQEDGGDQRAFPSDKQALLRLARAKPPVIASFHASWAPGHNSTDYERYYSLAPGSEALYKVEEYQSAYEPYVITSKRVSWCDERFAGYGANKAACLFEMYLSGVSFYVLSDHFLIHQSHTYEEEARREGRKTNRKVYSDFKEETCLRYLYRYYREGTLHSERAANARDECRKIKSIAKTVAQLTDR